MHPLSRWLKAKATLAALLVDVVPGVALSTSGQVGAKIRAIHSKRPMDRVQAGYVAFVDQLGAAVEAVKAGRVPEPVGGPGVMALPIEVIQALALVDPMFREPCIRHLAIRLALTQTTDDLLEVQAHQAHRAYMVRLSPAQREGVDRAGQALQREVDHLNQTKQMPGESVVRHLETRRAVEAERPTWLYRVGRLGRNP
jgi:hypothetical protein